MRAVEGHVAKQHSVSSDSIEFSVNSFHNFAIPKEHLASSFTAAITDQQGCVEATKHTKFPWLAIMWHPERAGNSELADTWLKHSLSNLLMTPYP